MPTRQTFTGRSILRDMAASIEERNMSRKKSNRTILEEKKRAYRANQRLIANAYQENGELEKEITDAENLEIVGIIRKHMIGLDNLEQIMQGILPTGESLFSEEKDKTEGFVMPEIMSKPRKKTEKKKEPEPEKEGIEHEEV